MASELSNLKCAKASPGVKPYSLFDGGGLHLRVTPSGGKLWRWTYRFNGKMKQMAIGKYPEILLVDARLQHAQARQVLAKGVDPMALRKETRQQKVEQVVIEQPKGMTFAELTRKWFVWWKTDKNERYAANVESRLEADVITGIGNRLPEDITRTDLVTLIQAIDARGARDVARRNLQIIRQIYDYGMDNGLLDRNMVNPALSIQPDRILTKVVEEHFASLPIEEIPTLLRKMADYDGGVLTRIAMELLSLTFLRTSELIGGLWAEIDWEAKLWRVPGPRMKLKRPHIVPLAPQALALLKRLKAITGETGRLFPISTGGSGVMSNNTVLKAMERMGYKGRMTGHGWRSVASTWLHENGFDHEHIEAQLAHAKVDKVSGAYNYALYMEPRTKMMAVWANALDELRAK